MSKIRGFLILAQFAFSVSLTIILMYLFSKNHRKIRRVWAQIQLRLMGIELHTVGTYDNNADMLLFNHQSMMDIVLFEAIASRDIVWVAKKEIGDLPWFGHILKIPKMIAVERESKKSLIKLLKDAKDRLDEGRQICIFPEGTRTNGREMKQFKSGAKVIGEKFDLRVQPVVILFSIDRFDSKKITQKAGIIEIYYLPTIQASKDTNWYEECENTMREAFYENLTKRD